MKIMLHLLLCHFFKLWAQAKVCTFILIINSVIVIAPLIPLRLIEKLFAWIDNLNVIGHLKIIRKFVFHNPPTLFFFMWLGLNARSCFVPIKYSGHPFDSHFQPNCGDFRAKIKCLEQLVVFFLS